MPLIIVGECRNCGVCVSHPRVSSRLCVLLSARQSAGTSTVSQSHKRETSDSVSSDWHLAKPGRDVMHSAFALLSHGSWHEWIIKSKLISCLCLLPEQTKWMLLFLKSFFCLNVIFSIKLLNITKQNSRNGNPSVTLHEMIIWKTSKQSKTQKIHNMYVEEEKESVNVTL